MIFTLILFLMSGWLLVTCSDYNEWSNFTDFCNECVIPLECKCKISGPIPVYTIFCNGTESLSIAPRFPKILKNSINCTNFHIFSFNFSKIDYEVAFHIENYAFTDIPPNAIAIQPRNFIRIYLIGNRQLRDIDSMAFVINGSTTLFAVDDSAMVELPIDVLPNLQLQFPPNLPIALEFKQSKFVNITTLRPTFDDLTSLITSISLDGNNFDQIPTGMFNKKVIMQCLNLNNNNITHLPAKAFHRLTLKEKDDTYVTFTGNPIISAESEAFSSVIASALQIELVEGGNFPADTVFVVIL